jgi:hypothetical protein
MSELIEVTVVSSSRSVDTEVGGHIGWPRKRKNTSAPLRSGQTAGWWDWRVDVSSWGSSIGPTLLRHSKAAPFGMDTSRAL